jgi:hypothetical protein
MVHQYKVLPFEVTYSERTNSKAATAKTGLKEAFLLSLCQITTRMSVIRYMIQLNKMPELTCSEHPPEGLRTLSESETCNLFLSSMITLHTKNHYILNTNTNTSQAKRVDVDSINDGCRKSAGGPERPRQHMPPTLMRGRKGI